jgi:ribosome-binding factor A
VRSQRPKKVKLHKVPELHFLIDESLQEANRIEEIIHKISSENEDSGEE